ncbi:MAG TPA: hypothetical protein VGB77_01720 [Abditibacteriaceae bacterium]|jgi:hypothetical protein
MIMGLCDSALAGWIYRANFIHYIAVVFLIVFIVGPLFLISLANSIAVLIKKSVPRTALQIFMLNTAIVTCLVFSVFVGRIFQRQDIAEAKAYPAKVAPFLEKYRKKHGVYPARLELLSSKPKHPRISAFIYGTDDSRSYHFRFLDPGRVVSFDEWQYNSTTRNWQFIPD